MSGRPPIDPARLEELVTLFVERREAGDAVTAEAFLAEHPEGGADLATLLAELAGVDGLLDGDDVPWPTDGRFEHVAVLGSGTSGQVHEVRDHAAGGARRALKLLRPGLPERAVERLVREGRILARLALPGVVRIHDAGRLGSQPFLLMERLDGETLAARLQRAAPLGAELVLQLGEGLARTLAAVHAAGVLHRDIKPGNVFLCAPDDRPVLLDFGLAADEAAATLTRSGDLLGTPAYMAPEQARGETIDARADVYGLGAILREALTGERPIRGADSWAILAELRRRPVRPMRRAAAVPAGIARVVDRAMAFRPARRHPDAGTLADDLAALRAGGVPRYRAGPVDAVERAARRHPVAWAAVAAVPLLIAGAVIVTADRPPPRPVRIATLHADATRAWLDGESQALERAAVALQALDDPHAPLYLGILAPPLPAPAAAEPALTAGHAGLAALLDGRPAAARTPLQRARSLAPTVPLWTAAAAQAAEDCGEQETALRLWYELRGVLGPCAALARRLGDLHRHRDEHGQARDHYRELTRLRPGEARSWFELARCEARLGAAEAGLAAIDEALTRHGPRPPKLMLRTRAALLDALGRDDAALAVLQDIAARDDAGEQDAFSLALVLDRVHRLDEARAAYEAVLAADPDHARAMAALAHLHAGGGAPECEGCAEAFSRWPRLRDDAAARRWALAALRADRGADDAVLRTVVGVAGRLAAQAEIAAVVDELLDAADGDDAALARLARARRELR